MRLCAANAGSEHRPILAARNEQSGNAGDHQTLAIRAARARSESASAAQTSFAGASSGVPGDEDAFLAATSAASGLRMTSLPFGPNNKGPGIAGAFDARS